MGYRIASWTTVRAMRAWDRMKDQRGQGTVEYVGMVVMVALLLGGLALLTKQWGGPIGGALKDGLKKAIDTLVSGITDFAPGK